MTRGTRNRKETSEDIGCGINLKIGSLLLRNQALGGEQAPTPFNKKEDCESERLLTFYYLFIYFIILQYSFINYYVIFDYSLIF